VGEGKVLHIWQPFVQESMLTIAEESQINVELNDALIILWSWNYHIMESYQGDEIIPWDHTMAMESNQGHGIIPRR
jgi:hypothetical protein